MAEKRPYIIVLNGEQSMVEALSPAQAVKFIVGAAVTELRVARGNEVSAWMRAGKELLDATAKAASPVADSHMDVVVWAMGRLGMSPGEEILSVRQDAVINLVSRMNVAGQITLDDFDLLRSGDTTFRSLTEALTLFGPLGASSVDAIRTHLHEQPLPWGEVEKAVAKFQQDNSHWSDRDSSDPAVDAAFAEVDEAKADVVQASSNQHPTDPVAE